METIHLKHCPELKEINVQLPASKSESNRALIINALCGNQGEVYNLSAARDTQTMMNLLQSSEEVLDVLDAGTTMRFLTAYMAIGSETKVLTGTSRMQERPIGILVDALKKLGAEISYEQKNGFPPLRIEAFKRQQANGLSVRGDQSSQFISALLMIAPALPEGLELKLEGHIASKPYIQMTLDVMTAFGVHYDWTGDLISVSHQPYKPTTYHVESDWSGASYWYGLVALSSKAKIKLLGLRQDSLQGDITIVNIMNQLGVMSTFEDDGVLLQKIPDSDSVEFDFSNCPDLAQTVAVVCAAKHIRCKMTGLESLKIKETDRIKALKKELKKLKAKFREIEEGVWEVKSKYEPGESELCIETYDDHRMAMAFAPLVALQDISVENPEVVNKSYPGFWSDLQQSGIKTR